MPISIEEFEKLPSEKPGRAGVSSEELIEELAKNAMTTAEVAAYLGVKEFLNSTRTGSAYSRLKKLLEKGLIQAKYEGMKAYVPSDQSDDRVMGWNINSTDIPSLEDV